MAETRPMRTLKPAGGVAENLSPEAAVHGGPQFGLELPWEGIHHGLSPIGARGHSRLTWWGTIGRYHNARVIHFNGSIEL
jgi:hypothetical protein